MNFNDILNAGLVIVGTIGGSGVIILGFSNYIGQLFAKRYEEKIKAKFQNDINSYQSQLDILKQTTIRYSDKQFELYSKLWATLYDLKALGDELWQQATPLKLEKFSRQLKTTKTEIEKASLFIEDSHYSELIELINFFSDYQIGKSELITFHQNQYYDEFQVNSMIAQNGIKKMQFEDLILVVKSDLKRQIGGN